MRQRVQFGPPPSNPQPAPPPEKKTEAAGIERGRSAKKPKAKNDPRLVAAARELRDRWLERVNADPTALPSEGKYDVSRAVTDRCERTNALPAAVIKQLPAAA